jgi:hypothetical protein
MKWPDAAQKLASEHPVVHRLEDGIDEVDELR